MSGQPTGACPGHRAPGMQVDLFRKPHLGGGGGLFSCKAFPPQKDELPASSKLLLASLNISQVIKNLSERLWGLENFMLTCQD